MSEFVFIPLAKEKLCGNCKKNSKFGGVVYSIPNKRLKNIAVCSNECVLAIFSTGAFGTEGQYKAGLFADTPNDATTTSNDVANATENVGNGQQNILSNDDQTQQQEPQQEDILQSSNQQNQESQEVQSQDQNSVETNNDQVSSVVFLHHVFIYNIFLIFLFMNYDTMA
jgi:hypothetical protein